jgi:hypothetical protein
MPGHYHNFLLFLNVRNMTTIYGRIEGERGPSVPLKQCAKLFIGKEPVKSDPQLGFEVCTSTILSISICVSRQEYFYITTRSAVDAITEVTYMLKTTNMLRPMNQASKAKDLLERLDMVASW